MKDVSINIAPNYSNSNPTAHLIEGDFKDLVDKKGYLVYHDKMIECPCTGNDAKSAKSDCQNCYGSGYVMVERVKCRITIQGMNYTTKFKEWSKENIGTARLTYQNEFDISFMDRVILIEAFSILTETRKLAGSNKYCFLTYEPLEVLKIFGFEEVKNKLIPLEEGTHYILEDNKFRLVEESSLKDKVKSITIRYRYNPQYHIIDIPRNVMNTDTLDNSYTTEKENAKFPLMAVGRISHFVIDQPQNYSSEFLDNTEIIDYTDTQEDFKKDL